MIWHPNTYGRFGIQRISDIWNVASQGIPNQSLSTLGQMFPSGRTVRNAGLKYFGGVVGVIGIVGIIASLYSYVWMDRHLTNVTFNDFTSQLAIFGFLALAGILMYIFIEE